MDDPLAISQLVFRTGASKNPFKVDLDSVGRSSTATALPCHHCSHLKMHSLEIKPDMTINSNV